MPTDPILPPPAGATPSSGGPLPAQLPAADDLPDPRARKFVLGTEGDDRLSLEGGATAYGGGGEDTFVLVSGHDASLERLGVVLDFNAGDRLDLSQLGENAAVVDREVVNGGTRVTIDYDGDGAGDGVVLLYAGQAGGDGIPADGPALPEPVSGEEDGVLTILPYPMPADGPVTSPLASDISGEDGLFTFLPYPMPGDGPYALFPAFDTSLAQMRSDWAI